jgi:cobalamin biosynthesis Mg chelatase CobN
MPRAPRPSARRALRLSTLAVVAAAAVSWGSVGAVAAHDDTGEMSVTRSEQTAPLTVQLEVGLVYAGDGHLAEDATVQAVLTGPDGATVGPVPMERTGTDSALYSAQVEVPAAGTWAAQISSTEPTATAAAAIEVQPEQVTPADGGDSKVSTPSTLLDEDDEQIFTTQGAVEDESSEEAAAADSDDGSSAALWIVLAVVAVVAVGGAALVVFLRRGRPAA